MDFVDLWNVNITNKINTFLARIYKSKNIEGNIICSNISSDAKIIAMSYDKIIVIFKYDYKSNEVKKIGKINHQANFIFINEKYQIIFLSQKENQLYTYDLIQNEAKFEIKEQSNIPLPKNTEINIDNFLNLNNDSTTQNQIQLIHTCEYNSKNNLVVYSTLNKQLYCVNLIDKSYESLPHPDKYITKISFSIDSTKIILVDENNHIYIIDLNSKKFDEWTKQRIKNEDYPFNYLKWYNKIFGICPLDINKYLFYTDYNYITLDLMKEIPIQCIIEKNKMDKYIFSDFEKLIREYHKIIFEKEYNPNNPLSKENKSIFLPTDINSEKNKLNLQNDNFKITSRFNSIMLMKVIDSKDDNDGTDDNKFLVVIENDWNNIVKSFPGALVKHNYGH
jgi:hypothetical protein